MMDNRYFKAFIRISIFICLCLLLSSIIFAYDTTRYVDVPKNSLPLSGSENFTFRLVDNETIYFNIINNSDLININMPESYYYTNNESYTLSVNWSMPDIIFEEDENITFSFISNNSYNDNSHSVGIIFRVEKQGIPLLNISGDSSLNLVNGTYHKDITVDRLPENGNMSFIIRGNPHEKYNVTYCGEFFICNNESFTLNMNGEYLFTIGYDIPLSTAIGSYNESFNITSSNSTKSINVVYNIKIPDVFITPPHLEEYCLVPNAPLHIQVECEKKLQKYRMDVILGIQKYVSGVNTDKICEKLVKTEFVIGDSISDEVLQRNLEILDENKNLRNEVSHFREKMLDKNQEILELKAQHNSTVSDLRSQMAQLKNDETQRRVNMYKASEEQRKEEKADILYVLKFICLSLSIIFAFCIAYKYFYEAFTLKQVKINYILFSVISFFFMLLYLSLITFF